MYTCAAHLSHVHITCKIHGFPISMFKVIGLVFGGGGRIKVFGCDELCRGSRSDEMRSETALYLCARLAVLVKGGTGGGGGGGGGD